MAKQFQRKPSTASPEVTGLIVINPDGTSVSGAGAGVTNVNIVSIDGIVPSLTVENLNVQLSHLGATPDSVRIGDGTTTASISTNGSINNNQTGKTSVALIAHNASLTNITTAAYVQLIASTSSDINYLDIFNSTGSQIFLATGVAASEVNQFITVPSGNEVYLFVASGTRVSARAVDVNATTGYLTINALS